MNVLRRIAHVLLVSLGVVLVVLAAMALQALRAPGADGAEARLAEWGRNHGLGPEVTWLERIRDEQHPPAVGGAPAGGIARPAGLIIDTALADEGFWQTVTVSNRGAVRSPA